MRGNTIGDQSSRVIAFNCSSSVRSSVPIRKGKRCEKLRSRTSCKAMVITGLKVFQLLELWSSLLSCSCTPTPFFVHALRRIGHAKVTKDCVQNLYLAQSVRLFESFEHACSNAFVCPPSSSILMLFFVNDREMVHKHLDRTSSSSSSSSFSSSALVGVWLFTCGSAAKSALESQFGLCPLHSRVR